MGLNAVATRASHMGPGTAGPTVISHVHFVGGGSAPTRG